MRTSKRGLGKAASFIFFVIISFCSICYFPCDIYNFQPQAIFNGNFLFNPYATSNGNWMKTNLHAHSVAWRGITNGKQQPCEILNKYKAEGYDYAAVSNYENVALEDQQENSVEVYEHGYNIFKTHQLVLTPQHVCASDFPLFQFLSSKQFMINKLSQNSGGIILAHPSIRNGYSDAELKKLTGYNLMEVLNHSGNSSSKWDVALSAGKPVWIVGNDDCHDDADSNQTFKNWTMINCGLHNKDTLLRNLSNGNAYAVSGKNAVNDNRLISVNVDSMKIHITLAVNADSIFLVGENGTLKKADINTNQISYQFLPEDTYIRTVAYTNKSCIYLNPVMRYNGKSAPKNISTATVNLVWTTLYKIMLLSIWFILVFCLYRSSLIQLLKLIKEKLPKPQESPSLSI